jgi:prophage regulatory protein
MLRVAEVERLTGRSRSSLYRDVAEGRLSAPVKIGPRAVAWPSDAIDAWLRSLCDRGAER